MQTQLRYVKDGVYAVRSCPSSDPFWYFYYADFGQGRWRCFLHDPEGSAIEEVGSGLPITDELQVCLPESAGYHRAARLHREPDRLSILDFAADRTIDYHVPDPWRAGPAQWIEDAFYWIEWQTADFQSQTVARLMSADRDFLEARQIGSDLEVSFFVFGRWDDQFAAPDFTTQAAAIYLHQVSEQEFWVRVRFDLFTGAGSQGPEISGGPPSRRSSGWPVDSDLCLRLGHEGLETWDGDTDSGYEPWNPDNLAQEYADMFLAGDRIYLSWGISTPLDPTAEPEGGFIPFHPDFGEPAAFCLA